MHRKIIETCLKAFESTSLAKEVEAWTQHPQKARLIKIVDRLMMYGGSDFLSPLLSADKLYLQTLEKTVNSNPLHALLVAIAHYHQKGGARDQKFSELLLTATSKEGQLQSPDARHLLTLYTSLDQENWQVALQKVAIPGECLSEFFLTFCEKNSATKLLSLEKADKEGFCFGGGAHALELLRESKNQAKALQYGVKLAMQGQYYSLNVLGHDSYESIPPDYKAAIAYFVAASMPDAKLNIENMRAVTTAAVQLAFFEYYREQKDEKKADQAAEKITDPVYKKYIEGVKTENYNLALIKLQAASEQKNDPCLAALALREIAKRQLKRLDEKQHDNFADALRSYKEAYRRATTDPFAPLSVREQLIEDIISLQENPGYKGHEVEHTLLVGESCQREAEMDMKLLPDLARDYLKTAANSFKSLGAQGQAQLIRTLHQGVRLLQEIKDVAGAEDLINRLVAEGDLEFKIEWVEKRHSNHPGLHTQALLDILHEAYEKNAHHIMQNALERILVIRAMLKSQPERNAGQLRKIDESLIALYRKLGPVSLSRLSGTWVAASKAGNLPPELVEQSNAKMEKLALRVAQRIVLFDEVASPAARARYSEAALMLANDYSKRPAYFGLSTQIEYGRHMLCLCLAAMYTNDDVVKRDCIAKLEALKFGNSIVATVYGTLKLVPNAYGTLQSLYLSQLKSDVKVYGFEIGMIRKVPADSTESPIKAIMHLFQHTPMDKRGESIQIRIRIRESLLQSYKSILENDYAITPAEREMRTKAGQLLTGVPLSPPVYIPSPGFVIPAAAPSPAALGKVDEVKAAPSAYASTPLPAQESKQAAASVYPAAPPPYAPAQAVSAYPPPPAYDAVSQPLQYSSTFFPVMREAPTRFIKTELLLDLISEKDAPKAKAELEQLSRAAAAAVPVAFAPPAQQVLAAPTPSIAPPRYA